MVFSRRLKSDRVCRGPGAPLGVITVLSDTWSQPKQEGGEKKNNGSQMLARFGKSQSAAKKTLLLDDTTKLERDSGARLEATPSFVFPFTQSSALELLHR